MVTKLTDEYVAGFFDGEGCFKITKQYHPNGKIYGHHSIMLSQSGDDGLLLLKEIQKEYGGQLYQHLKIGQHKATKNAYKLYWNRDEGRIFIERIIDKLILKKDDAQLVLNYLNRNSNV